MQIKVTYSKEKDIDNYINSVWRFKWNKHGRKGIREKLLDPFPENFKKNLTAAEDEYMARDVVNKFLQNDITAQMENIASALSGGWDEKGAEIISKLEKVYGGEVPFPVLTIYLTTLQISPYNYNQKWIMVAAHRTIDRQLYTITHELNHFMFYYYFPPEKLGIKSKQEYESLKEALTVLTSPEEQGYPAQQKLRAWLKKQKGTVREILQNKEWKNYL